MGGCLGALLLNLQFPMMRLFDALSAVNITLNKVVLPTHEVVSRDTPKGFYFIYEQIVLLE